jgi:hypothetical protein
MAVAIAVEPVCAQTAIGVGTGVANSRSSSNAGAVAIGGGNATGGNGGNSRATIVQNTNVPASQSITNVPTTFAPGLSAAGIETCLGSVSGGGSWLGTGISLGGTIPDPGCATRLDARTLWSMGLKKAAVARLCLNSDIYRSMPDVCYRYLPVSSAPAPYVVAPIATSPVGEPVPLAPGQFASHDIWLVEGKTGKDRLCKDYDSPRQRCLKWDGAVTLHYAAKKTRPVHSVGATSPAAALASINEDHSK